MKKLLIGLVFIALALPVFALTPDFEKVGDTLYDSRNSTTISARALATIDAVLQNYQSAMEIRPSDTLMYKYTKAIDFKYYFLFAGTTDDQMKVFQDTIAMIDKYCSGNTTACFASPEINYCKMVM